MSTSRALLIGTAHFAFTVIYLNVDASLLPTATRQWCIADSTPGIRVYVDSVSVFQSLLVQLVVDNAKPP